ncbi:MAG: stalk domain-containing protein [Caldisericia bacterium]|nr:stalk domain-containing protein [Caldisericia bacterium]
MKKSLFCLVIIILISPLFIGLKFQNPKIYIEPQNMSVISGGFGSFDIRISNITDLYGASFDINIPLSNLIVEDTYISDSKDNETNILVKDKRNIVLLKAVKQNENRIIIGISRIGQINGITGSGLLLNVKVKGGNVGVYDITLNNIYLFDSKMRQIQVDTIDAKTKITVYPVDSTPPTIKFIKTPPQETNQTLSIEFQWEGSDDKTLPENLIYSYKLDDSPWSDWKKITKFLTPNLKEGDHTFSVKAKDEANNESNIITYTFKIDITPPILEISSPLSNIEVLEKILEIKGKTEPGITVKSKDISVISDQQTGDFKISYTLNEGENKIEVKAIDKAGNETIKTLIIRYKARTIIRLQIGNLMAVLNDKTIILELAPFIENGRTLVPLRFIAESFGAKVNWEPKEQKITITLETKTITLWVGKKEALVNNQRYYLEVPPKVIEIPEIGGGRTVVPLRFVSEALGAKVDWDPDLQIITITYPGY